MSERLLLMAENYSLRIKPDLLRRIRERADRKVHPYAPSITAIIERGITLALDELEEISRVHEK